MIKIGLVGEAPSDTNAIKNLLSKRYLETQFTFTTLLEDIHGSELDNKKTKRFLRIEFEVKKPDVVIFIRDLDGLENNTHQLKLRKEYFSESNSIVNRLPLNLLIC